MILNLKNTLALETIFRGIFVITGIILKFTCLPKNFTLETSREYIFDFTQITFYTDYAIPILVTYCFLLLGIARYYRRRSNSDEAAESYHNFFRQAFLPNMILIAIFLAVHEVIKPLIYHSSGFNLSGHMLRRAISNGIIIRNVIWINYYKKVFILEVRAIVLGTGILAIVYAWYENFCTALYFHTFGECIVGFSIGLATIWIQEIGAKRKQTSAKKDISRFVMPKDDFISTEFKPVNKEYKPHKLDYEDIENGIRTLEIEDHHHHHERTKLNEETTI